MSQRSRDSQSPRNPTGGRGPYGGRKARHRVTRAILARLDERRTSRAILELTPPGRPPSLKALDEALGLAPHRLSQIVYGHVRLDSDVLCDLLDRLGEDPASFFAEALGPGRLDPLRLLAEVEAEHRGEGDPVAGLPAGELPAPGDEEGEALPELEERLARLDERRVVEPRAALPVALELWRELAAATPARPSRAHVGRLCRSVGAIGSMARNETGGFGAAARCLGRALAHAERHDLGLARAELLQRAAYLLSHKGRRPAALLLAGAAKDAYLLEGDLEGVGKALVTLGTMQHRLGHPAAGTRSLRAGLRWLPEWDWWGREAAHQVLAVSALAGGQPIEAERELERAEEASGERPGAFRDRRAWIGGEIALARGENAEAAERFEAARRMMGPRHPLEVGLLSIRLAKAYLRLGRRQALHRLAADLVGLLEPLAGERLAVATLTEVARALMAGEVREQLLDRAAQRLWKGYPALAEYPLQAPPSR